MSGGTVSCLLRTQSHVSETKSMFDQLAANLGAATLVAVQTTESQQEVEHCRASGGTRKVQEVEEVQEVEGVQEVPSVSRRFLSPSQGVFLLQPDAVLMSELRRSSLTTVHSDKEPVGTTLMMHITPRQLNSGSNR